MRRIILIMMMVLAMLLVACSGATEEKPTQEPSEEPTEESATEAEATSTTASATAPTEEPAATEPAPASEEPAAQTGGMLQKVRERGNIICGVNAGVPGFGYLNTEGTFSGFDVDFCKVVAAAVFGDPDKVEYRQLTAQERFTAVQTGEVDILIRNTTNTLSRETSVGLDFGPTTFYDGQGMMVRKDSGITTLEDMDGATICVQQGTTTELNLADNFRQRDIEFTPVTFAEADPVREAYDAGQCDGFTTDKSGLVSQQSLLSDPTAHKILDVTMSKEPLGPSVLQGDPQWRDIMTWAVYATFQAEEFGITSENVEEMKKSEDPNIIRFLGGEGELGEGLGLSNDFVVNIIKMTGNYAEIYNRNLGPDTPFDLARGLNAQYYDGGLIYSPPFR